MLGSLLQHEKLLSILLMIAVVGDFAVPYLLAPLYRGYRHTTMVMSTLGNPNSPVRKLYNLWLVLLGVLLLLSCNLIYLQYGAASHGLSIAAMVLIIAFAVGAGILAGTFSVNEQKEIVTTASKIHGAASALGFMLLLFVPLLLSILSFQSGQVPTGILFAVSFLLALIFFVLFVMADKPEFQSTVIKNEGLWQRLTLFFMYLPLFCIAIRC